MVRHTSPVETADARALRGRRQRFAAPGGFHDRLIRILAVALPMAIGVVAALVIIVPLSPRGEVSFLLDRNRAEVTENRLSVDNALYRGLDRENRPFSLKAGEAVQHTQAEGLVRLRDLVAQLLLPEGPARVTAQGGIYDLREQRVTADGPVLFTAADGYRMLARGVAVDMTNRRLVGQDGVSGEVPAGTFRADRLEADLATRTITLDGNARITMVPGRLRMP
ncbi:LPS export ABC transporter periplasmic protein LptC [Erythrobacteraceae bacterium CFH 75059]|uniref:LPS export ABC transporter periplasmic protein LptC n=1 Tax=Qipengyuania thermophila TaxID=2509361 RepID=UPI00101F8A30|nr:LPS export ABC transporter periplasmic protein LptC [Qipengyuania thermophila]TCD06540.1 LPS export ABC transporter periplasmic protein LptC [Erythrobacteraceae bacterium CFH 75059]